MLVLMQYGPVVQKQSVARWEKDLSASWEEVNLSNIVSTSLSTEFGSSINSWRLSFMASAILLRPEAQHQTAAQSQIMNCNASNPVEYECSRSVNKF